MAAARKIKKDSLTNTHTHTPKKQHVNKLKRTHATIVSFSPGVRKSWTIPDTGH